MIGMIGMIVDDKDQMLKLNIDQEMVTPPDTIFSPSQWLPFHIYEWWPRFPRYAPNPFMLNHPSFYYYQIGWHSKYATIFPHSHSFRMLRAIATNDMPQIVQLLENGFPVDSVVDPKYGYNAVQLAAMTNHFPLIEVLALRGADLNLRDRWGNTSLMIAVANQNHQAIHSLLRNGCDMTIKNRFGMTAIDKAADNPNIQQFISNFNEKKRGFPKFSVKMRLESLLRPLFWEDVKAMKVYTGKVVENPMTRWQFDFSDYREVSELA